MGLPDDGPCSPWISWAQATGCCRANLAAITDEADQLRHLMAATYTLYGLTGYRFPGLCSARKSFCAPARCCTAGPNCWDRCRCGPSSRIDLAPGEWAVAGVDEVVVAGEVLVEGSDYRLDDYRYLVRLDGARWPDVADLTDPEALEVVWRYGRMPPAGYVDAVGTLTCELAAACLPGEPCNLPFRVTGVTAEGVSYTLIDPTKIIDKGFTGLYRVDLWVAAVNGTSATSTASSGGIFDPGGCSRAHAIDTGDGPS